MSSGQGVIEVVCAVVLRGEEVLLCQRPEGKHLAGAWEFPGGKIDKGESAELALKREIREELGCEIELGEELVPIEHQYPELAIKLRPFICSVREREPEALEHAALAWVRVEELLTQELAEADQEVARQLACRFTS